jgi:hypothetical protein
MGVRPIPQGAQGRAPQDDVILRSQAYARTAARPGNAAKPALLA